MSEKKSVDINLVELVTLAVNILQKTFISSPKDKVKPLFKELKSGKSISLGSLTLGEQLQLAFKMELDYSEFRGPGFNSDVLKEALKAMLIRVGSHLRDKKDLNILTSETGTALIHLPGIIQINQQLNVLVMAFDISQEKQVTLKLMFIDPDQYEQLKS